jgi:2-iminobutanoate/2-iminopropanoate deaminase
MSKTVLVSPILATPNGIMSHGVAVPAGKMVFVSGQVSRNPQGEIVGIGDIRTQTRQVLENMISVLAQGGATMDDVVKVTVFVTNVAEHYSDIHEIRAEYFPTDYPASTMVEVKALVQPELLIEIEAIAVTS